jgi:hypothetical protein
MGYVYAVNPFVGKFVYEVHEPASVQEKRVLCQGVGKCSSTGNELAYYANWEPDRMYHVYATKAEATVKMNEDSARKRAWDETRQATLKERGAFAKRVHFEDQEYAYRTRADYLNRTKNIALCQPSSKKKPGTMLTADKNKVTCANCLQKMEEKANWKGFPKQTKEEKDKARLAVLVEAYPHRATIRRAAYGGYYLTLYAIDETEVKAICGALAKQRKAA